MNKGWKYRKLPKIDIIHTLGEYICGECGKQFEIEFDRYNGLELNDLTILCRYCGSMNTYLMKANSEGHASGYYE